MHTDMGEGARLREPRTRTRCGSTGSTGAQQREHMDSTCWQILVYRGMWASCASSHGFSDGKRRCRCRFSVHILRLCPENRNVVGVCGAVSAIYVACVCVCVRVCALHTHTLHRQIRWLFSRRPNIHMHTRRCSDRVRCNHNNNSSFISMCKAVGVHSEGKSTASRELTWDVYVLIYGNAYKYVCWICVLGMPENCCPFTCRIFFIEAAFEFPIDISKNAWPGARRWIIINLPELSPYWMSNQFIHHRYMPGWTRTWKCLYDQIRRIWHEAGYHCLYSNGQWSFGNGGSENEISGRHIITACHAPCTQFLEWVTSSGSTQFPNAFSRSILSARQTIFYSHHYK